MSAERTPEQARMDAIERRLADLEEATGLYVPDKVLDSPKNRGERVTYEPSTWRGKKHKGRALHECEPEFLRVYASFLAWSADNPKPGKERYAASDRFKAALCRSMRRRLLLNGGGPPTEEPNDAPGWGMPPPPPVFEPPPAFDYGAPPVYDAGNAPATDPGPQDDDDFSF